MMRDGDHSPHPSDAELAAYLGRKLLREELRRIEHYLAQCARMEEALALAQREIILNPDTAHPFYWAGFQLLGRGGAL